MNSQEVLKEYFGYEKFKEGQGQLIDSILSGKDCLGVMPTGAGKSICFQIPALIFDGITLVVSPLISLMKDQVNALKQTGIKSAFINSSLTDRQIRLALNNARAGMYKIIYIAPERLETNEFADFAYNTEISMVTVDEAHCISQWGQDFRPSYIKIASFISSLPVRPVVSAFTATATPKVREDIIDLLKLQEPSVLVTGFDRKNLTFSVKKPTDKFKSLTDFLSGKKDSSGIVYCATRKTVEDVHIKLNNAGYNASRYHAGLSDNERRDNQDDFLYDKVKIMVATNAFGMGIDKSNVSFVVHYNMPRTIESYYQEAGRAGRDGEPAECVLLYSGQDVQINMFLIENNKDAEYPDAETEKILKDRERQRLKEMTFYCHTNDCLRAYILKYFGEKSSNFCDNCSNCHANFDTFDITIDAQKILSCVIRSKERYGVSTIIDILRGSKNEKITRLGLDRLSTYNICSHSEKKMRDIINYLVLNEFLYITDDRYPVLKCGQRSTEILRQNSIILMKLVKEELTHDTINIKNTVNERHLDKALFEKLRILRLEIAKEQSVPAFVIFSDSTLTDMCIKQPINKDELLKVSGVGQVKLERYGERFIAVIAEHVRERGDVFSEPDNKSNQSENFPEIEITEEFVTVSVIADRINCVLMQKGIKNITGARLNEWLVNQGYLFIEANEKGRSYRFPTERGTELGIVSEKRVLRGENCYVNYFNKDAQQLIVDKYLGLTKLITE